MLKCTGKLQSDSSNDMQVGQEQLPQSKYPCSEKAIILKDAPPCKSTDPVIFAHESESSSVVSSVKVKCKKKSKSKSKRKLKKKLAASVTNHSIDSFSENSSNSFSENPSSSFSENLSSSFVSSDNEISNSTTDSQNHSEIADQNVSKHFKHISMADDELKTVHKGHIGDSLWIVLKIDGQRCVFLLDSGSQVSLLRNSMDKVISKTNVKITTASGAKIQLDGFSDYSLQIGNLSVVHRLFVSEFITENTIGTDFLVKTKSIIDLNKMRLTSKNFNIPIYTHHQLNEIQFMYILSDHTQIPCLLPEEITAQFSRLPNDIVRPARQLFIKYQHLFNSLGNLRIFIMK
jgi:hypothetical protein